MDIHQLVSVVGTTALATLLVLAGVTAVTGPAQAASDEPDIDIEVLAPDKVTEGDQVTIKIVVTAGQEVDVRVEVEGEPIGSATVDPSAAEEFEYTTTVEGTGTRDYNIDVHNDDTDEYLEGDTVSVEVQSKQQGWLGGIVSGFKNALQSVLFSPFTALAEALFGIITHVITSYPDLHPNAAVQEVHRIAMLAAVGISTLGVIVAGLLYQVGPILGYSYRQARLVLPRILVGLLFGAVAPFLLQYAVEFASALTIAFKPTHPDLARVWQLQSTIIIVTVIDATLLLMVAVLFVIRDVYLMFGAAIAPLLAVAWAIPGAKRYADPLISAWWAALLIGPLDMMILRLLLALLDPGNGIPHYIYAFAGLTLLLIVPYIVFSASGTMTGVAGGLVLSSLSKAGEKLPDKPTMKEESYSFAAPAYRTTGETKPSKQAMNSGPRVPRSQRGRQKPRSENKFSDHFDYLDIDDKRGDRQ